MLTAIKRDQKAGDRILPFDIGTVEANHPSTWLYDFAQQREKFSGLLIVKVVQNGADHGDINGLQRRRLGFPEISDIEDTGIAVLLLRSLYVSGIGLPADVLHAGKMF